MTPKCIAILNDPHPCGHIVYPYTDEPRVLQAVGIFARAGIEKGEAVAVIATDAHCTLIKRDLAQDFDLLAVEREGRFMCFVAEDLLAQFMVNGMPDPARFKETVGAIIQRGKSSDGGTGRNVRMFGEMVSLLWRVDVSAARRLEELWNEVIEEHTVSVLCTYTLDAGDRSDLPSDLLEPHTTRLAS